MRRRPTITLALSLALGLLVLGALACTSGEEAATEAQEAEWAALQEMKAQLDAKREELAELRQQRDELSAQEESTAEEPPAEEAATTEAAEGEAGESEAAEPTPEKLEQEIARLEQDIADQSEEFMGRLVQHINSLGIVEGEPLTPDQKAAIRMKTEEDMQLAEEWIEKGGDYKRAISIYESALALDPDNQELQAALEEAREMRFMTEERFSAVEKGMTREEVREALGPVNLRNIQEYPDKNAVAWFYPKEGTSSPAAVWFRKDDETGIYEVYQADFDVEAGEE
ncbi:MAG: hypothetical protein R3234_00015 [Thermoanaerobaculia bacterium]|nr:hypothetical protein [Thermoanaerobaculia bacterium]